MVEIPTELQKQDFFFSPSNVIQVHFPLRPTGVFGGFWGFGPRGGLYVGFSLPFFCGQLRGFSGRRVFFFGPPPFCSAPSRIFFFFFGRGGGRVETQLFSGTMWHPFSSFFLVASPLKMVQAPKRLPFLPGSQNNGGEVQGLGSASRVARGVARREGGKLAVAFAELVEEIRQARHAGPTEPERDRRIWDVVCACTGPV